MFAKPVRPLLIFRTQIKIFLIKSESSLNLHRQQRKLNVPRPWNVVSFSKKKSIDLQFYVTVRICFVHKGTKNYFIQLFFSLAVTLGHHYGEYHNTLCLHAEGLSIMADVILVEKNCWIKSLFAFHMDCFADVLTRFLGLGTFWSFELFWHVQ